MPARPTVLMYVLSKTVARFLRNVPRIHLGPAVLLTLVPVACGVWRVAWRNHAAIATTPCALVGQRAAAWVCEAAEIRRMPTT